MASEIRVNQIQSRTGVSTISFTETGPIISGVTTVIGNLDVTGLVSYDDVTNIDSIGIITARDGIRVTGGDILLTGGDGRKISFAGDGSAHYFKMDNTLNGPIINGYGGIAFETNGANERLRITSGGNIGIGTAVPATKLNVIGDTRVEGYSNAKIQIKRTGNTVANGSIEFLGSDDSFGWGLIANYDAGGSNFNIKEGSNSRLYIKSGSIGIGNDDPDGKLAVTGNGYNQINIASNNTANTNKLGGVTSQNYVGDKWSIIQTYSPSGSNQIYYGSADGSYRGATSHYFYVNSSPTATTGHTEALRITSSGNIEIGSYTNSGNTVIFKTDNNNTTRINFYDENNTEGCYLKAEGISNGGIFRMGNRWNTDSDKISFNMVDGTIGVPNGGGLSFAATSDGPSMSSELLDDYEEGTWTPTMNYATGYGTQTGKYVKVGKTVHAWFEIQVTGWSTGSGSTWTNSPFGIDRVTGCWAAVINGVSTTTDWRIGPWTAGGSGLGVWMSGGQGSSSSTGIRMTATSFGNYSSLTGSLGSSFTMRGGFTFISTT